MATGRPNYAIYCPPSWESSMFPDLVQFGLRVKSSFRTSNMFASYLIVAVVFGFILLKKHFSNNIHRWLIIAALLINIAAAIFTKSRFMFGIILAIYLMLRQFNYNKITSTLRSLVLIILVFYFLLVASTTVWWVFPIKFENSPDGFFIGLNNKKIGYFLNSITAYNMFKDNILFGVGMGRFIENKQRYIDWEKEKHNIPAADKGRWLKRGPHSTYLGWAARTGLLGISALFLFLCWFRV